MFYNFRAIDHIEGILAWVVLYSAMKVVIGGKMALGVRERHWIKFNPKSLKTVFTGGFYCKATIASDIKKPAS